MSDFRQAVIDAILEDLDFDSVKELRAYVSKNKQDDYFYGGILYAINAVQDLSSAQPVARDANVLSNDTISRQAAIDALDEQIKQCDKSLSSFYISMKEEFAVKAERASLVAFRETLEYLLPAEPKTGRWIYCEDTTADCVDGYRCDQCGLFVPWDYQHKSIDYIKDYNFCPNCGAKMEE